jgi:hypothetical protein
MSKQTKKITLEALAATMEAGFKRMDTGFKRVDDKMDAGFKKAEENRESLARMISNGFEHTATKEDIAKLEKGQATLEQGQENIQLRVDSLAPYFEVKHLERRVKRLEDRAGIRNTIQH